MKVSFNEIREKLWNSEKRDQSEGLRKLLGNFTLNFWKVCRKSVEFQYKFGERLNVKTLELQNLDQVEQKIWRTVTKI